MMRSVKVNSPSYRYLRCLLGALFLLPLTAGTAVAGGNFYVGGQSCWVQGGANDGGPFTSRGRRSNQSAQWIICPLFFVGNLQGEVSIDVYGSDLASGQS